MQHCLNRLVSTIKTFLFLELTVLPHHDELIERCKQGEASGYKELYHRYAKAMFNTCLRIINDIAEAEDVLQESFAEAFRHLDKFEYRTSFGGWLKQICINRSINQLKKRKIKWEDIDGTAVHNAIEETGIDENEIVFKVETVKKAIQALPDGYRTVLSLYLLEGYDHEEIGEILNVAESTTRTQYMRAKQKLLQLIKEGI
jgi:RNA polymerase sigma factor (sigma-70 family)